jgi:hypothetical protein
LNTPTQPSILKSREVTTLRLLSLIESDFFFIITIQSHTEMDRDPVSVVAEGHLSGHVPRSRYCAVGGRGVPSVHAIRAPGRAADRLFTQREIPDHV